MKITYDRETDSMTITFRDERIKESDEVRPGVIADFGYDGAIVRFEILAPGLWSPEHDIPAMDRAVPKYASWPGYEANLQFVRRRYCAL